MANTFDLIEKEDILNSPFTPACNINNKLKRIQKLDKKILPDSYHSNTTKEELCLEFVKRFNNDFHDLYPKRRALFTILPNEVGIEKFVCTTIRPTELEYNEMYNLKQCAEFISSFIEYEPLADPFDTPKVLCSPSTTLKWKIGDCFDYSTLLTSYLIGIGYDAYVCYGHAPLHVTLRDRSATPCPIYSGDEIVSDDAFLGSNGEDHDTSIHKHNKNKSSKSHSGEQKLTRDDIMKKYSLKARTIQRSKYEIQLEQQAMKEMELKRREEEEDSDEECNDQIQYVNDNRVHCWVLVIAGKRDVTDHVFIEATTGAVYPVSNSPYFSVEAVWNHNNYWVNKQEDGKTVSDPTGQIQYFDYDLENSSNWEYIFFKPYELNSTSPSNPLNYDIINGGLGVDSVDGSIERGFELGSEEKSGDDKKSNNNNNNNINNNDNKNSKNGISRGHISSDSQRELNSVPNTNKQILDLPSSWVPKLLIDKKSYELRYCGGDKLGQHTIFYLKSRLDLYGKGVNSQGIVRRLTTYSDINRSTPIMIEELFDSRQDKLFQRRRYPVEGKYLEFFRPGLSNGLKAIVDVVGKRRQLNFYTHARTDGLKRRTEILGEKIHEEFDQSSDQLVIYRSVTIDPEIPSSGQLYTVASQLGEITVTKMIEKFRRSNDAADDITNTSIEKQVSKATYYVLPKKSSRVSIDFHYQTGRIMYKSFEFPKDDSPPTVQDIDHINESEVKESYINELKAYWFAKEKSCYSSVREYGRETSEILNMRKANENYIVISKNIFEKAAKKTEEGSRLDKALKTDGDTTVVRQVDYLTPFLPAYVKDPNKLTKEVAKETRDACLRALKDRLLDRANIIQKRLDNENTQLAKRQAAFQRSRDHVEGIDDEFEQFCHEAMFRIQILDQRLQRHEETALIKYADLNQKLRSDSRLSALNEV